MEALDEILEFLENLPWVDDVEQNTTSEQTVQNESAETKPLNRDNFPATMSCYCHGDNSKGWKPPNMNQCIEAFTKTPKNFREQPNVLRLLSLNTWGAYTPKLPPVPGDWLADGEPGEDERPGQTFKDFCKYSKKWFPNSKERVITLVPIGPVDADFMEIIREYTQIFFYGMDVEIGEELDVSQFRYRPRMLLPQLKTLDIFPKLTDYRRDDQFCVLGVTMKDLYPEDTWNFVYGEADIANKVALFSFCRMIHRWFDYESYDQIQISNFGEVEKKAFLLRSVETVAHEIMHLFNIQHCVYFECMMNGTNNDRERDRNPAIVCPICQRKVAAALNNLNCFKPMERCHQLVEFFQKQGFTNQADILQKVLESCETNEELVCNESARKKKED